MPLVGFEPTISAGERPQTYALDLAVTGTGVHTTTSKIFTVPPETPCIYSYEVQLFLPGSNRTLTGVRLSDIPD